MTLDDFLLLDVQRNPEKIAVRCGLLELSYRRLNELVEARSKAFEEMKHQAIVFRCTQDEQFLIDYLAIHRAGAVAVPLEKDYPEENFQKIQDQLSGKQFPEEVADVLFTTGTTGNQKGVMISHRTIIADGENLIAAQGFKAETCFIICGPLNHIGCLSKVYPLIMQGASMTILEGMKDLNAFFKAVDEAEDCVAMFLVPASIRMILALGKKRFSEFADKIDFIETGAAAIFQSDMEEICNTLPKTRMYNTYASTETGIIATYNFQEEGCEEGCLGKAMKNSAFYISDEGRIVCQGETLMVGYVDNEEMTRKVLHDGCLFTTDNGTKDTAGRLHLRGRSDDVINTGGLKVDPLEVENVAMKMEGIIDCVCIAAQHPVMGVVPKLLYVLEEGRELKKRDIALFIDSQLESFKVPVMYAQVEKINRTYNGKIDRKSYK